ncbi:long-chain fatty acid--CoA ligase [Roseomonas sp. CCTCC AB2023176]|uniref:long-chain-fatty-acid--CoA ligase n=1 Tax=Roseomonas sp. CCTCC AB2023176 TaxID=3342640 RepID=UPI0035DA2522
MLGEGDAPAGAPPARAYPAGVRWDMDLPPETLPEVMADAVRRFGPRPALDFFGRKWTYVELGAAVERAAEGLRRLGAGPGVRVGLCLPNCPWFVVAYFAALRAGATVVNYSPLYAEEEMAGQARDSGTEIMVSLDLDPILPRVLGLLNRDDVPVRHVILSRFSDALPIVKGYAFRLLKGRSIAKVPAGDDRITNIKALLDAPPIASAPAIAPTDLAVLQYTGGTTGVPKGAMLTHANLCANTRQVNAWFTSAKEGQERTLAVIPFFHVFAMTVAMNASIAGGAEIVMLPRFDWALVQAALRRTKPTVFPGVPTLFKAVLDKGATREELGTIHTCISGGAPLPAQVKEDFERLSGCTIREGYGLTETSPVCFCNPAQGESRSGTIGLPLPRVRAEIRDLADPSRVVPLGERGELCVAGPNVMAGYWKRDDATAEVLGADGFLRTGDVGVMDADGYVTLVDRIKDLILVSGFNVYPRNIEEAIYRHADVVACTVVGMPDAYRGEAPAAFVQLRSGSALDEEGLRGFLKDKLSSVEMPRLVEFRGELPRTIVGKLSKKELKAELLRGRAA